MPVIQTFHTSRLTLRDIVESDAPAYERNFVDYEIIRNFRPVVPWPYPEGGVLEYLRNELIPSQGNNKWAWAITLKETPDDLIGLINLWRPGTPDNRGFWLGRRYWGKGYMTEAVQPVMDYAFNELGFDKLIFSNAVGNSRSARIKEKTGARMIGLQPARYIDPIFTEQELYEITKAEWGDFKKKKAAGDQKAQTRSL